MNIIEAYQKGRKFKRLGDTNWWVHPLFMTSSLTFEDIFAQDYVTDDDPCWRALPCPPDLVNVADRTIVLLGGILRDMRLAVRALPKEAATEARAAEFALAPAEERGKK